MHTATSRVENLAQISEVVCALSIFLKLVQATPYRSGMFSMVYLLVKIACFVSMKKNPVLEAADQNKLVQGGQPSPSVRSPWLLFFL
jgi:hypothetical protein